MARFFQYLPDAMAGAILGGAVSFAVVSVFQLPMLVGASLGGLVFVRVIASLIRLSRARVPSVFEPIPLSFEEEAELLLDESVSGPAQASRVVRLFESMPTPGAMHEAIERHLAEQPHAVADATEELREALAQLRRSVG